MHIHFDDDFHPGKIAASGQCFRVGRLPDGSYRFPCGSRVLYLSECSDGDYEADCTEEEWNGLWQDYFDLHRSYTDIRDTIPASDTYLTRAAEAGQGIRILRQDRWEMLISFIISQRKSIPAIRTSIERLCSLFGEPIVGVHETLYSFPTPEALSEATPEQLSGCGLGYRVDYVLDAASRVVSGELDLEALETATDRELLDALMTVRGVGTKVANCVALFAYGRMDCAPIDVWISRVIDREYGGTDPFPSFPHSAGILQQYMFYLSLLEK